MANPEGDQPPKEDFSGDPDGLGTRRLWTPWRMRYVGGTATEAGCIFCNRLAASDDVQSLILHRGTHAFIIMNLFPYNTGHTMIVPNEHSSSPEDASPECIAELGQLRRPLLRALRRALSCHGFNLGMNIGTEAGAGIADHLHEHIVPRWTGDANFMLILAHTTVMPELIPVTYAKLRAEIERELTGSNEIRCVALGDDDRKVLVNADGRVPSLVASNDVPLWKVALATLCDLSGTDLDLIGWAGDTHAAPGPVALTFRLVRTQEPELTAATDWRWIPALDARRGPDGDLVANALANRPD